MHPESMVGLFTRASWYVGTEYFCEIISHVLPASTVAFLVHCAFADDELRAKSRATAEVKDRGNIVGLVG